MNVELRKTGRKKPFGALYFLISSFPHFGMFPVP